MSDVIRWTLAAAFLSPLIILVLLLWFDLRSNQGED